MKRKNTKSAEATSMAHARAWVEQRHPGSLLLEAGKQVKRFPDKERPGEWKVMTISEDLFGMFDIAAFPRQDTGLHTMGVDMIQVTTINKGQMGNVNVRKAKVGNWVRTMLPSGRPAWLGDVFVVGWVSRKHLRIWRWTWNRVDAHRVGGWREDSPNTAPLPKRARSASAPPAPLLAPLEDPF